MTGTCLGRCGRREKIELEREFQIFPNAGGFALNRSLDSVDLNWNDLSTYRSGYWPWGHGVAHGGRGDLNVTYLRQKSLLAKITTKRLIPNGRRNVR